MKTRGKNGSNSKKLPGELTNALKELDREWVEINGKVVRPSQCYHVDNDPPHILFNTNCPDHLRDRVEAILSKFTAKNEDNPSR